MNREEELYEPPEWVKFVNRVLKGKKMLEDERPDFERVSCPEEAYR